MDVEDHEGSTVATIAAAIGEPARARMLYGLMDGHARTSTELSAIADISPSTASAHLGRLKAAGLVTVAARGKHRYYSLAGGDVAAVLEGLSVLAGSRPVFVSRTPVRLRTARTCYDHIAGAVGVQWRDRLQAMGWILELETPEGGYDATPAGIAAFAALGVDVQALHGRRRRFASACLDWSERRPHLGGALGAALRDVALRRQWVSPDPDGRALTVTPLGRRQMSQRFGVVC